jgi:hypothetical protein
MTRLSNKCSALVPRGYLICVKGDHNNAWIYEACVMSSPSSHNSMFICSLNMTNLLAVSELNPLGSTRIALIGSLEVGSHLLLCLRLHTSTSISRKGSQVQERVSLGASIRFLQQNHKSLFALRFVYSHFDVAFLDLYTPCSPYSVFTITWNSYRAHSQGIPMEPLVRDLWNSKSHQVARQNIL